MTNVSSIKKLLSSSTTMPHGTGQTASHLLNVQRHTHDHEHKADGSCCGHVDMDDEDDEDCCDNTSPKGGCC